MRTGRVQSGDLSERGCLRRQDTGIEDIGGKGRGSGEVTGVQCWMMKLMLAR